MGGPSSSSSGEEDGSTEWREALQSIVATTSLVFNSTSFNGSTTSKPISHSTSNTEYDYEEDQQSKPRKLTHYQIKAQKLLDGILEKSLEVVGGLVHVPDNDQVLNEGGVRLFRHSAPGIVFDHEDELKRPRKKPRIIPGKEIDMKSKKFRRQLQSVVVDGVEILDAAKDASQKSLARLEAKEAAAKAKAKREEERVAELKGIRGERWLPSIAREMQAWPLKKGIPDLTNPNDVSMK